MGFLQSILISAFALGVTCNQLQIPEVEEVVASILQKYSSHVNFKSNVTDVSASKPAPDVHTDSAATSSYWYENIAHQGISAFGPSGYTVYRNVKDYGATGFCLPSPLLFVLMLTPYAIRQRRHRRYRCYQRRHLRRWPLR